MTADREPSAKQAAWLAVVGLLSATAGWLGGSDEAQATILPARAIDTDVVKPTTPQRPIPPEEERSSHAALARCTAKLQALQTLTGREAPAISDPPVAIPGQLEALMQPGPIDRALAELQARCDPEMEWGEVDCSEYPCMTIVTHSSQSGASRVIDCPEPPGYLTLPVQHRRTTPEDGGLIVAVLQIHAEGKFFVSADERGELRRSVSRARDLMDELELEWDSGTP